MSFDEHHRYRGRMLAGILPAVHRCKTMIHDPPLNGLHACRLRPAAPGNHWFWLKTNRTDWREWWRLFGLSDWPRQIHPDSSILRCARRRPDAALQKTLTPFWLTVQKLIDDLRLKVAQIPAAGGRMALVMLAVPLGSGASTGLALILSLPPPLLASRSGGGCGAGNSAHAATLRGPGG